MRKVIEQQLQFVMLCVFICAVDTAVIVKTGIGDIEGTVVYVANKGQNSSLTKFLGIPYAEPPIGNKRFMKPVPKKPFSSTFRAFSPAPTCYQIYQPGSEYTYNVTEDCLHLNIYVPNAFEKNTSYPVMLWIHGGANIMGSSNTFYPETLSMFGGVIVVTINYRLGAFGFLRSDDGKFIGNQGLWDQQMAIRWVHNHIAKFQGDPDHVTIFGESAGASSVTLQALYAGNKGLIHRAIAQSGSGISHWTSNESNAQGFIDKGGCNSVADTLSCMQQLPPEDLLSMQTTFLPTIDGDFIVEKPRDIVYGKKKPISAASRDLFASVDLLIGTNTFDGAFTLPMIWAPISGDQNPLNPTISMKDFRDTMIPIIVSNVFGKRDNVTEALLEKSIAYEYTDWSNPNDVNEMNVVDLITDYLFLAPTVDTIEGHKQLQTGRSYLYEFNVTPTKHLLPTPVFIKGSNHADELQYIFAFVNYFPNVTPEEKHVSLAMMTMWTNFAKTGNPNTPSNISEYFNSEWPEYDMTSQKYFKITNKMSESPVQHHLRPKQMAFWLKLLPELNGLVQPIHTNGHQTSSGEKDECVKWITLVAMLTQLLMSSSVY